MAFDFSGMEQITRAPGRVKSDERFRGSAEEMRERALHNSTQIDEQGGFGLSRTTTTEAADVPPPADPESVSIDESESEVVLDSPEAIDNFYTQREISVQQRLELVWLDDKQRHEVWDALDRLKSEVQLAKTEMLTTGGILSEDAGEKIQFAYEALEDVVDNLQDQSDDAVETATLEESEAIVEESFDPNTYIVEQFAQNPYLIPSQRTPVYLLQREYKRAVAEGAVEDAEILAQQIKDYVDELVGDEDMEEEEYVEPLPSRASKQLVLTDDDGPEQAVPITQKLTPTATPGIDFNSGSHISEAVALDLKETEEVTENLRALREEYGDTESPEGESVSAHEVRTVTLDETPEQQLQRELAEYGVTELEPDLSEEAWGQPEPVLESVLTEAVSEPAEDVEEGEYTEAELTSHLYGMQVPTSRSENYSIASFREGVKVAMRHDPDLAELPGKQELFEELLTFLEYIPDGGLSEEAERELVALVRKINDPKFAAEDTLEAIEESSEQAATSPLILEESQRVYPEAAPPVSFTPEIITRAKTEVATKDGNSQPELSVGVLDRESRQYKKLVQSKIEAIEGFHTKGFFSRWMNEGQSPYERLADESYEGLVLNSQSQYVDSSKRREFLGQLKQQNIDQQAFENWMQLVPEIDELGIETNGKTFKEVLDLLIDAQIQEGNTQSL